MSHPDWPHPMFAAFVHDDRGTEVLGGPFGDIDDVIDCCWDSMEEGHTERCFFIEATPLGPRLQTFPPGVFPA
ncbi:MAG: hypothetical protein HY719_01795 [Planctomycetes bacterium]|nr:hypothetical protein [Planctomycetota bacterium]